MMFRVLATALAFCSTAAFAQTTGLLTPSSALTRLPAAADAPRPLGWVNTAKLAGNLSFASSQDVIGQTDGSSQTYGLNLKAGFYRFSETDEWRTDASLIGATTRNPSLPRFVKSNDEAKLSTIYLLFFNQNPNFGPYIRGEVATPVFRGEDVQSTTKTYRVEGRTDPVVGQSYRLTDGFKPLTTKEGIGLFYRPSNTPALNIETRLGFTALQTSASGNYAVGGVNPAGEIQVNALRDINQAGLEAAIAVKGKVDEKSGYEAGIETLTPFINNQNSGDDRSAFRLTNVDGYVKLTSNITSWASFGYDYKLKIQPQLLDRAQQIHMIVINVNYNLL